MPSNSLCVIGHPIAHSLSPLMHTTAFKALDMPWTYEAVDVEPPSLKKTIRGFVEKGLAGFNVTIPHKEAIIQLLDEVDDEAGEIGAVNTVKISEGKAKGFNTDLHGIVQSLNPLREQIEKKSAVVIGTGGAARAVVHALIKHYHVAAITVASRSEEKARAFILNFVGHAKTTRLASALVTSPSVQALLDECILIVNATPLGMSPRAGESPLNRDIGFHREQIVFDLIYTPLKTTLLKHAESEGAHVIGGLEMLLHQGAKAFELWTGKRMPIDEVRKVLTSELEMRASDAEVNDKAQMTNEWQSSNDK